LKKLKLKNNAHSKILQQEELMYSFVIADTNYKKYKKERTRLLAQVKEQLKENPTFTFKLLPNIKGYIQSVVTKALRFDSTTFQKENIELSKDYIVERISTTIVTDNVEASAINYIEVK